MRLVPMRIPASGNRESLLLLSIDRLQIQINSVFRYSYVGQIDVPTFLGKIKKLKRFSKVPNDLLSELMSQLPQYQTPGR